MNLDKRSGNEPDRPETGRTDFTPGLRWRLAICCVKPVAAVITVVVMAAVVAMTPGTTSSAI